MGSATTWLCQVRPLLHKTTLTTGHIMAAARLQLVQGYADIQCTSSREDTSEIAGAKLFTCSCHSTNDSKELG